MYVLRIHTAINVTLILGYVGYFRPRATNHFRLPSAHWPSLLQVSAHWRQITSDVVSIWVPDLGTIHILRIRRSSNEQLLSAPGAGSVAIEESRVQRYSLAHPDGALCVVAQLNGIVIALFVCVGMDEY